MGLRYVGLNLFKKSCKKLLGVAGAAAGAAPGVAGVAKYIAGGVAGAKAAPHISVVTEMSPHMVDVLTTAQAPCVGYPRHLDPRVLMKRKVNDCR